MKYIKGFEKYLESITIDLEYQDLDLLESLTIFSDSLIKSINGEEVDIFKEFNLDNSFIDKIDIDYLKNNSEFNNSLSSIDLRLGKVENSDDYQTFINKSCKFAMIYKSKLSDLDNPDYILFQEWNDTLKKWDKAKLYKVNGDVKRFYDSLTSKTIEILDGSENYIYHTSNGNDWYLKNDINSETFKKQIRRDELQEIISKNKIKVSII